MPPLDTGRYGNTINKICLKGHQRGPLQYCPKCWLSTGHWVGQVSQVWYCYKLDINCYQQNLHNYMYLFIGSPDIKLASLTESVNHGHMYSVQFYWPVYLVFIKVHCYWWCSPIAYDMQSFLLYCSGKGLSKLSNLLSITANLLFCSLTVNDIKCLFKCY